MGNRTMKTKEWGTSAKSLRASLKRALTHPKLRNLSIKSVKLNKSLTKSKGNKRVKVYDVVYTIKDSLPKRRRK